MVVSDLVMLGIGWMVVSDLVMLGHRLGCCHQ